MHAELRPRMQKSQGNLAEKYFQHVDESQTMGNNQ